MCCGQAPCKTNMTEEEEREKENRDGAEERKGEERYFVCIELTHVTIVKSPRDTWLRFRGAPALCVIHAVIEESLLLAWVSQNKKMDHFLFSCGFCLPAHKRSDAVHEK